MLNQKANNYLSGAVQQYKLMCLTQLNSPLRKWCLAKELCGINGTDL